MSLGGRDSALSCSAKLVDLHNSSSNFQLGRICLNYQFLGPRRVYKKIREEYIINSSKCVVVNTLEFKCRRADEETSRLLSDVLDARIR